MSNKSRKKGRKRQEGGAKPHDPAVDEAVLPGMDGDAAAPVGLGGDAAAPGPGGDAAERATEETRSSRAVVDPASMIPPALDPTAIDATAIDPALLKLDPHAPPPDWSETAWLEAAKREGSAKRGGSEEGASEEGTSGEGTSDDGASEDGASEDGEPESGETEPGDFPVGGPASEPPASEPPSGESESGEPEAGEITLGEEVGSAPEVIGAAEPIDFNELDAAIEARDAAARSELEDEDDEDGDGTGEISGDHLKGLLEALIFASDKPLKLQELAKLAHASLKDAKLWLRAIKEDFLPRGIKLDEVAEGFVFRTDARYARYVRDMTRQKPIKLSRAQIETLAILAYRQPITRPEIDEIRGVDCGPVLKMLLDRDLIRILGKKDEPGRPLLYGTTPGFLEFFGLKSLKDLPTLHEFTELNEESRKVVERELGEVMPAPVAESFHRPPQPASVPDVQATPEPEPAEAPTSPDAEDAKTATDDTTSDADTDDTTSNTDDTDTADTDTEDTTSDTETTGTADTETADPDDAEEQILLPLDDDEDPSFGTADDLLPEPTGSGELPEDPASPESKDTDDDDDHSSSAGSE
ncbi:SMC-Scp complex subunit ScpB [Pendulispora albinea]|uniref:SMC-Scp complex subunit ScpB n=1 Tax=Pendulispora albinea TaxID=2741071 RepID=A0ABZ2M0A2_9BACT